MQCFTCSAVPSDKGGSLCAQAKAAYVPCVKACRCGQREKERHHLSLQVNNTHKLLKIDTRMIEIKTKSEN